MINSISSGASFEPMQRPKAQPLTSEQTELMSETLSQFDPENLTTADAQSIVAAFQEAGIQPGQEMQELMAEAGFDAAQVGEMGRPEGGRPPGPPPQGGAEQVNTQEMVSYLDELLTNYSDQLNDEDKASILASVQEKFGLSQSDSLLSVKA
ncbi:MULTISPECIES: hypothetical protein [Pseudoalteromonas]|uniref:Orphan protein n=1 Tax=Pseudoalteromonas haloplanktis TaxID=228 RepID=A0ABU1BF57_PSEHA|nr:MULTISPECIES: hypothetical protein [Pseudoalteromonas]MCF6144656.1 hypothetical protein [Pseudoalteromonas mariniglutinosa NCIMB 1770]MDQ9093120.1 hypothetical protein [Pseudoalteromonas haloplanktis]TMN74683.1 hypothetical protein CWB85_00465 [Pseudoalteromonas sp. S1727]BDF95103.1 hypothetical protein KAN5_19410 [Pseudoalteromonas sp. KAN5]